MNFEAFFPSVTIKLVEVILALRKRRLKSSKAVFIGLLCLRMLLNFAPLVVGVNT
jgi:hypothetical protein